MKELTLMDIKMFDEKQKRLKEEIKTLNELSYNIIDILDDIKSLGETANVLKLENLEDFNKIKYLLGKLTGSLETNMKTKVRKINEKL